MSDNPFASPNPIADSDQQVVPSGYPGKPMTPGWITAICVISLVLGVLGLFTICFTVGGIFMNQTMQSQLEAEDSEMAQAQARLYRESNKQIIPNIIFQFANLLITTSLIIGSIMTLTRKSAGPGLLRKVFLIAIVFNVLRSVFTLYVQIRMKDVTLSAVTAGNPPNAEMMRQFMETFYYVGLVFALLFAMVLIGFYVVSYLYFGSETADKYFATFG